MMVAMNPGFHSKYLFYGPAGSGKTWTASSALWNALEQREVAIGKYISFGQEDNPMLGIPEHMRHTDSGISLRLKSPELDDTKFLTTLKLFAKARIKEAAKGNYLDFIVLDGLSELGLLYENATQLKKWDKWEGLLAEFFSIMQLFDPDVLGSTIVATARVIERKKGVLDSDNVRVGEDPEFMESDYYPAMRGAFKQWFSHYFLGVHYCHTRKAKTPGPAEHVIEMSTGGDYLVKNQSEHLWFPDRKVVFAYPAQIVNGNFYDIHLRHCAFKGVESPTPWKLDEEVPSSPVVPTAEDVLES